MKKLSFLALAAAGLMMVGCSDKDVVTEVTNPDFRGQTEGYFKINLNLPTAQSSITRADDPKWGEEGQLDDGLDAEYQIDNILLLLYEGADESTAQLKQVIQLTDAQDDYNTDDPNQVTTRGTYIAQLKNAPSANLYALAVVNGGKVISYKNETTITIGEGNGAIDLSTSSTIDNLRSAATKMTSSTVSTNPFVYEKDVTVGETTKKEKFFFMTNAVLSSKVGGEADPTASPILTVLAPINADCIYESEAAAKAPTATAAAEIFVERAVAKVTVDFTDADSETEGDQIKVNTGVKPKTGSGTITATLIGWTLDNTNTESFILRKVPAITWNWKTNATGDYLPTDPYRFVGYNKVLNTQTLYRTYWAEDPNYNKTGSFSTATEDDFSANKGNEYPRYCFENTFDVEHQIFSQTTRALIKVNLNSSKDFYTIGIDHKTLYTLDDVMTTVKTNLMNQPAFITWFNDNAVAANTELVASDVTVVWKETTTAGTPAGKLTVKSITINASKLKVGTTNTITNETTGDLSNVISTLNSQLGDVEYFKGGISYYQIRIKHFGDILTPWNTNEYGSGDKPAEAEISTIYPGTEEVQNQNYLGRYGMVRNNWYLINLNEIIGTGNPVPPSITSDEHPDDELEDLYIKANINVLSWAKRPQTWNLKK